MTTTASAGRIETRDIEELQQVVWPWDVILRQISPGRLHTRMDYLQVNGILLYREHWSHRIIATGATPPGFFFFGGPSSPGMHVGWCGAELNSECLAFGSSSTEADFVTPDAETHICLLVPDGLMLRYLGEELAARVLPNGLFLACQRHSGTLLLQMMERILDKYIGHRELLAEDRVCEAIEWQLLGGLVELLLTSRAEADCQSERARYRAAIRAIELCERSREPIKVVELAAASGVSKRVLELAFEEVAGTTPQRYIRWSRMNRVRKELLAADRSSSSVTQIACSLGFTELGRFAVDYKNLFGESPSTTLAHRRFTRLRQMRDISRIDWCGAEIGPGRHAFGRPATEVGFILPEGSDYFALLVPEGLMLEYLGEELGQAVRDRECRHRSCNPALGDELIRMIHRLIDAFLAESDLVANKRVCKAAEWEIMGTLVQMFDTGATDARCASMRRRRLTLLRAIAYAQQLRRPMSVPDFAAATGLSKRVLEMAFHETLNVTPVTYLRWSRMHGARRSLLAADEGSARVKQIAAIWGFSEPGRFAVEYRRLFGESPSTTLRRSIEPLPKRLTDALRA